MSVSENEISKLEERIAEMSDDTLRVSFSKPRDRSIVRARGRMIESGAGTRYLQIETFTSDNKVTHKNIPERDIPFEVARMATGEFSQTNLISSSASLQIGISSKGRLLINKGKGQAPSAALPSHDKKKNHIIDSEKYAAFLSELGVCDKEGRVFDKKRAKYRQLNRFVELLDDVYDKLPKEGELTVCDLCCGKSYLTFAVYLYLEKVKGRQVEMYGVDLKSDVIDYCHGVAERMGLSGLHFVCGDISNFDCGRSVDLVVSLHACDIATDIVLAYAIEHRARLILSTPCCHHEMFHQLGTEPLAPIMKHSILKQKFADLLTDSMRTLMLEAKGYRAEAIELIDPDETPKNVMIRAAYTGREDRRAMEEYDRLADEFGVDPTLRRLLAKETKF